MNGTTNFIVIHAKTEPDFAEVLSKAQELGTRARPDQAIDGIDVRSKTMISASIAFGVICTDQIPMSGIRETTKARSLHVWQSRYDNQALFGRGVSDGSNRMR